MRLIDADELRKQFEDRSLEDFTHLHFIEAIDNAPTVEPEIANDGLQACMTESYRLGYELAKTKFKRPTGRWVEVKTRPCTDEEFEEYKRIFGDDIEREEFSSFICPMPSHGDEILICTPWGVDKDKCEYDPDYGYGLEERGDWEDVTAWMPLPKPYKKKGEE